MIGAMRVAMVLVIAATAAHGAGWSAKRVQSIEGFDVPECVMVDASDGTAYVSSIQAEPESYWADDGRGYISRIAAGETPSVWAVKPLHSPKGMCVLGGELWVTDNTRIVRFALKDRAFKVIAIDGAQRINDLATDGRAVFASDTGAGKIYRIDPADGKVTTLRAPESVNGVTFARGRMFAVSWDLHEVFELDPTGRVAPKAFGLASHFKALDGIEVLADGTFIVSDFVGNRVVTITPDRRRVRTLIEMRTPADIGLDRQRLRLYVPLFKHDLVEVYQLIAPSE